MKYINVIFFILFLGSLVSAQPVNIHSISSVLKKTETDSIRKIERQAAIKFHQLLNNYRSKKGRHLLRWSETLWIASYNHTLWMETNEKLSHVQKKGTTNFTGENPGDRYNYAAGGKSPFSCSAENALYNYSGIGNTIDKIANNIAVHSLEQWIDSPDHHENMLSKNHGMHGTAFRISADGIVWGTDLFAACDKCPKDEDPVSPLSDE
jgi:uncharacterized protein YkwD